MKRISLLALSMLITVCTVSTGCKQSGNSFSSVIGDGGGTGTASIAITSASPTSSTLTMKQDAQTNFIVAAVGTGALTYKWTVDGVSVGANHPTYTMQGSDFAVSPSSKLVRVEIYDTRGSTKHEWTIKINGPPTQSARTPTAASYQHKYGSALNFSVTYADPNNDTLTYAWKLNGQEGVLSSSGSTASFTPSAIDVGTHQISVDVRDGAISDSGTYLVTQSWTVVVNHFNDACNDMENLSQTNKTCVHVGISSIGEDLDPTSSPTSWLVRPAVIESTSEGNLFIGDDNTDVIYFWNRASSPSTTVLGHTVPINSVKVVAGVAFGGTAINSTSTFATRQIFQDFHGLSWDGTNLYVSDTSNNRVVKIDSSGVVSNVITAGCNSPRALEQFGSYLYIACYSSHVVRRVNLTDLTSVIFMGTGTAGDPADLNASTPTDATRGRLRGPYGLTIDSAGNILVSEYDGCRVRMINQTASTITLYGTYTIPAGNQRIILGPPGTANCNYVAGEAVALTAIADARIDNPRNLSIHNEVLYIANHGNHSVTVLNFGTSTQAFGSVTVPQYQSIRIIGNGSGGYQGESSTANATRFNTPYHAINDVLNDGDILVADYGNLRLRRVRSSDHRTQLVAGNGSSRSGTAGNGTVDVSIEKMNNPRGAVYDSVNKILFIADMANHRIRSVNKYGEVAQAVGLGVAGSGAEENELPSIASMNNPRGLALTHSSATFGGHLVWADTSNHRIRIWNRSTSQQTLFGVSVDANRVATIAGDGTAGTATTGSALQAAFNAPSGVAFDGTDLYVADTSNHCIKKINSTGDLSVASGTCGSSGNAIGAVGTARMSNPEKIAFYSSGTSSGLFIADRGNSRVKFYRISGSGAIAGVPVSVGDTNNVFCGGTYHEDQIIPINSSCSQVYDVTVVGNNVCFVNYFYHNVRCVNLGTSLIQTTMGPLQGDAAGAASYFPRTSVSASSQNGVPAAIGIANPSLSDFFGSLTHPMFLAPIDSTTFVVGEYGGQQSLIRRVKLP